MKTAIKIRDLDACHAGDSRALYRMEPPHEGHEFVVVSALDHVAFGVRYHETYLFEGDSEGEIVSYTDLDGSMRGTTSHAEALKNAGYRISRVPS